MIAYKESKLLEKKTYKDAGVDLDTGNEFVKKIKPLVKSTFRPEVMTDIGGFGSLFSLNIEKYKRPVLVSTTDGVGTKLRIAFMMDKHDTIGIDLVAMCVNDLITLGAEPLFFLDYISTSTLIISKAQQIISGIIDGCKQANCSLIGGETAEMPSVYKDEEYDLVGFATGIVDDDKIIDGSTITVGDKLIGIKSSGLHSNGFSLVREVLFNHLNLDINSTIQGIDKSIGEELITPTKIYAKAIQNLIRDFNIHGISHITGGGLLENIPRILPRGCKAFIYKDTWDIPPIFRLIKEKGNIEESEMYRTFNNGIGMVIAVSSKDLDDILIRLKGLKEEAFNIGEITQREKGEEPIKII
ncbi:MAG: phosphoribosylformylglycinamidine cyclo-ligase [Thermodesulfobacteriota bacterium]|nr:phosphoribosylformylglycinamidine cyclo-ligase [Thermodesulfobacteriota bacterium]